MKNKFLFLASLLFALILLAGCGEKSATESYTEYLKNFSDSSSEVYYLIRDIDNDGTKDLILSNNASLTIYTYTDSVKEVGSYDFVTGTVQYLYSDNKDFPGIFYTTTGGGYNHYGYITVKDGKVTTEDLWKEDFSGISGEKNKIEDLSENKALVDESKSVSQKEQKINFEVMKGSAE